MKRLLLVSLLVVVAVPAQAHAAIPCRDKIFNDWNADGKIASTYPHACYVDALRHVPPDANEYSSLRGDITAAMRAAVRQSQGKVVPKQIGRGFASRNVLAAARTRTAPHDPAPSHISSSSTSQKTVNGPELVSSKSGTPLPVLLLGGLALALVAAGAVGAAVKHSRSRRR
jgi:hypothetical protein